METDAKQRGILSILVVLGALIFLLGGSLTGYFNFREVFSDSQAAERPEFDPEYLYARALQLYEGKDRATARDVARRVIHLKPNHKDAHKLLAAIAMREQDYRAALEACKRLLMIDPVDMNGQLGVGIALRKMGETRKAEEAFRAVIGSDYSTDKQREEAHLHLAELNPPASEGMDQGISIHE